MQDGNGSARAKRLRRNPYYRWMQDNDIRSADAAKQAGYDSVSSMYKALRFEKLPEPDRLAKIAATLRTSPGDLYTLWRKEMSR